MKAIHVIKIMCDQEKPNTFVDHVIVCLLDDYRMHTGSTRTKKGSVPIIHIYIRPRNIKSEH
jgi:hypothetical protein